LFSEPEIERELKTVVERWPGLPEHIKGAIITLVRSASYGGQSQ
jgi:hypothetical protein